MSITVSPWFAVLPRGSGQPAQRLYCFPHAGAGHTVFQPWRALMADDIELALIKLPGHGARFGEPHARSLVECLASEIAQASAEGETFALFGHSMGALLAFETARALRKLVCRPRDCWFRAYRARSSSEWRICRMRPFSTLSAA